MLMYQKTMFDCYYCINLFSRKQICGCIRVHLHVLYILTSIFCGFVTFKNVLCFSSKPSSHSLFPYTCHTLLQGERRL